jgi:hypothetical protein
MTVVVEEIEENNTKIVRRKPRASGISKLIRKCKNKLMTYAPIGIRYGIMPSLLFFSLYYTEPSPNLSELLNPFF